MKKCVRSSSLIFLPLCVMTVASQAQSKPSENFEFGSNILRPALRVDEPALLAARTAEVSAPTGAAFNITLNYSGDAAFAAAFNDAVNTWESIIPNYIDGRQSGTDVFSLTIEASVEAIDGVGGTLGSAGPTFGGTDDGGYFLSTAGTMKFDVEDFDSSSPSSLAFFENVVLHEMGHVLGIGTLWELNNLYDPAAASVTDTKTLPNGSTYTEAVGRYTGAGALAGYQAEFGQSGLTYVPIEKGGGGGTANGHWDEGDGGVATGRISAITGEDMNGEVMTGWANGSLYISNVTRGGLQDLGYDVSLLPVPEPGSSCLLMSGLVMVAGRRKRA